MPPPASANSSHFKGNTAHLEAFQALLASPIRSNARERALTAWSEFKLREQLSFGRRKKVHRIGKHGYWGKKNYIKSLLAPAIDLRGAVFTDVCLGYADLRGVRLDGATFQLRLRQWTALKGANLQYASLRGTCLVAARLMETDFRGADLTGAQLPGADLTGANLGGAVLRDANLCGADLTRASLVGADLRGADLTGCRVYGISAWDLEIDDAPALQRDLIVTKVGQSDVKVDRIEVAQFVYLLLTNPKIRGVVDTVCRNGVLILGRFTAERKIVLDALRDELRRRGWVPMVFDFEKPVERDLTETVKTLAGLSRFIVADITNPRSSPLELQAVVPDFMVPVVTIIAKGEEPFAMFRDLWTKYRWVLDPLTYPSTEALLKVIEAGIIAPALRKRAEILESRIGAMRTRDVSDYEDV